MVAMRSKTVKYVSTSLSLNNGTSEICLLISNSEELTGAVRDAVGRGDVAPDEALTDPGITFAFVSGEGR